MTSSTETHPPKAGAAALAAAVLTVAALMLLKTDQTPGPAPVAPSAAFTRPAAPASLRNVSYYPEQLAVLQSLSSFQPIADAGEKPAPASAAPARLPVFEAKAVHRPESPAKTPATTIATLAPQTAAPAAAPPAAESGARFFGLSLPAGIGGVDLDGLRDAAGGWGAAMGAKVSGLWR